MVFALSRVDCTLFLQGLPVPSGPEPPDLFSRLFSFLPQPPTDLAPVGFNFGDILEAPPSSVSRGQTVSAK